MTPADSTLFVTGIVVVEGTVGLASTHPFRSSRAGAVTARKISIEDNFVLLRGAFQFLLHSVKPLK